MPVAALVRVGHVWVRIMRGTLRERFIRKSLPTGVGGCWLWMGYKQPDGYGQIWDRVKMRSAHRVAYELFRGPIPDGLHIDHLCRNRMCVNPEHLEAVTQQENTRRGAAVITHCPQGHPYEGGNLYVCPRGKRECRTCRRDRKRVARARKKEENNGI